MLTYNLLKLVVGALLGAVSIFAIFISFRNIQRKLEALNFKLPDLNSANKSDNFSVSRNNMSIPSINEEKSLRKMQSFFEAQKERGDSLAIVYDYEKELNTQYIKKIKLPSVEGQESTQRHRNEPTSFDMMMEELAINDQY